MATSAGRDTDAQQDTFSDEGDNTRTAEDTDMRLPTPQREPLGVGARRKQPTGLDLPVNEDGNHPRDQHHDRSQNQPRPRDQADNDTRHTQEVDDTVSR